MNLRYGDAAKVAGLLAPTLWLAGVLAVTMLERNFLQSVHWSPVRRSEVEWPSILMIGEHGWLVSLLFVVCGLLELLFAAALLKSRTEIPHDVAAGLMLIAIALCLVAIPPDPVDVIASSWHDHVHNSAYPIIPIVVVLLQLRLVLHRSETGPQLQELRLLSALVLPLTACALAASTIDSVAQLARYFLFASIALWLAVLALLRSVPARDSR